MTNEMNIGALKDEQLESVAGGWSPDPVEPYDPSKPTGKWILAKENPIEIGGGNVACPKAGCDPTKPMEWEGNSDIIGPEGEAIFCYRYHCTNERCKAHYARLVSPHKYIWYIEER